MTARARVTTVAIAPLEPGRLEPFLGPERVERLERTAGALRARLEGRRIVNVNSTATGGGVAEMLQTLLGYVRGAGLATEWLVIEGDPAFFAITKRVHNGLYGGPGDGGALGDVERSEYERTAEANLPGVRDALRPGDVVLVHDPQPAGLVPTLLADGHAVVWRCHVGLDTANEWSERAWEFVRPYVRDARAFVFSRRAFAPRWVDERRLAVIPPAIDPLAPKNESLDHETVLGVLATAGLIASDGIAAHPRVEHPARIVREGTAPAPETPLVVQVSRWDRMKDMAGVMRAFASGVDAASGAHLVLAGPAVEGVDDDPEGLEVWNETVELWRTLAPSERECVHLVAIPMDNPLENALVVNALQTHARSSSRRASPRDSGSPWPRRCGSRGRSSPARSAGSQTRSSTERAASCSTTPRTSDGWPSSPPRSSRLRRKRYDSA